MAVRLRRRLGLAHRARPEQRVAEAAEVARVADEAEGGRAHRGRRAHQVRLLCTAPRRRTVPALRLRLRACWARLDWSRAKGVKKGRRNRLPHLLPVWSARGLL